MKRNILLLTSLVGLLLLEYSCDSKYPNYSGMNLVVTGIGNTELFSIDSDQSELGLVKDSVAYNRFKIKTTFADAYVSNFLKSNFSAVADPAPPPMVFLELDSIIIKNTLGTETGDISSKFQLGVGDYSEYRIDIKNNEEFKQETKYANADQGGLTYNFYMLEAPSMIEEYKFKIRYYLTNGEVYETETQKITLTP